MIPASDIEDLTEVDDRLSAAVRGTMPYQVAIWVEGAKKPRFSCTCPQGEDGKFCKHAAAVALTLHGGGRAALWSGDERPGVDRVEDDPVFEFLLGLDHAELARLVYDAAQRDSRTAQRIEAKAAASVGQPAVDVKEWRKAVTAAFGRPSRFVDYYEAPRWAAGVQDLFDGLRELLDDGNAAEVIPLVEYAFERADRATGYVDSSDGCFGQISWEIEDLHLRACTEARPDPVALARRLVGFELDAELDTFRRAAATYVDVLGDAGLAEYRRLVQPRYEALPPPSDHDYLSDRFHVTDAMLGLARACGDTDEVVAIRSASLRSPHDYEEIVEVLEATGRIDDAIDWARQGLSVEGREHQKRELRNQLVALLVDTGDHATAVQERLDAFHDQPSLATYKDLIAQTAGAGSDPATQRAVALDWLHDRAAADRRTASGSLLVEILLNEGDVDAAWDAARAFGCDERWWMTLARAREATHPLDAIPVYERAVESLIDKKNAKAYSEAVKLMARLERLHAATDDDGWATYLAEITTRHRAKRSLLARIRDQGWE
ncbi:MAG TPA: SWIM zinc finger family protein [Microthrixaceae bacterium]|nr:SWIM zinc finger family protein [Microthrixaceae bacterium]